MDGTESLLKEHFEKKVLTCATMLQAQSVQQTIPDPQDGAMSFFTADMFGEQLLACLLGLHPAQVTTTKVVCRP